MPGAVFTVSCDKLLSGGVAARFQNDGRFEKTVGDPADFTWIDLRFDNQGTDYGLWVGAGGVAVTAGELWFQAGGGQHSSRFFADGTTTKITFSGGTHTCQGGTVFEGTGWIVADNNAVLVIPNGVVVENRGRFELASAARIKGLGGYTWGATTYGMFDTSGTFKWTGGRIQDMKFRNTGNMDIAGENTKFLRSSLLLNLGTVTWSDGNIEIELSNQNDWCVIWNYALFDVKCDKTIVNMTGIAPAEIGQIYFLNDRNNPQQLVGTFRKSVGNGTKIEIFFRDFGVLDLNGLTVDFAGGYKGGT